MPIPTSQKACVFNTKLAQVELKDAPVPQVEANQVLLKVQGAGICHTDVHILEKNDPAQDGFILGHEIAGTVVTIGSEVDKTDIEMGKLYAVFGPNSCGKCLICRSGRDNVCTSHVGHYGVGLGGGYQEYAVVKPQHLVPVPNGVSAAVAAVITDAVITPYHAAKLASIASQSTVLIFGIGGLGLNAIQIVKNHFGAKKVIACDLREETFEQAKKLGADEVYSKLPDEPLNVDIVLDIVGLKSTFEQAQKHVKVRGTIIPVGLGSPKVEIDLWLAMIKEIKFQSTFWGTTTDLMECLDLVATGVVVPQVETCSLGQVNDIIHKLAEGKIKSRMVVVPQ